MDKNYGLTEKMNNAVDTPPEWMDSFFNREIKKTENPFKGVDNFLNIGLQKEGK